MCRAAAGLLLAGLAACTASPAAPPCRLGFVAEWPVRISRGDILLTADINGLPARLVLDTGSFSTVLTERAAQRLGLTLHADRAGRVVGIGGGAWLMPATADILHIGRLTGTDVTVLVGTVGVPSADIDGYLGADLLAAYDVDLDIGAGRVRLYRGTACPRPAVLLAGPRTAVHLLPDDPHAAQPRLVVSVGGRPLTAALDTGAPGTVLFREAAASLGLDPVLLAADRHFTAHGIGAAGVPTAIHVAEPITIGALTVLHMPVAIPDEPRPTVGVDMLLGLDFASRVHLWLSHSSHSLVMQYPPQSSPRLPAFDGR